jgi:hypothetical protein
MTRRARVGLFVLLCLPLFAVASWLILRDAPAEEPAPAPAAPLAQTNSRLEQAARARALEATRRADRRRELRVVQAERGQAEELPGGEPAPPASAPHSGAQRSAEPIARRFFAAYSLYELGRLDDRVRAGLEATATGPFAAALLGAPPRVPPGAEAPPRAELGPLQLVPLAGEGRSLESIELVGAVRRGAASETFAILLERHGRPWLVTGVGR